MTDGGSVLTTVADGIAKIIFNRPEVRNALTAEMMARMTDFLRECEGREDVRAILMTGAGDHFMAGGDVKSFTEAGRQPANVRRREFEALALDHLALFEVMERLAKPIVAKVRGACAGASVGYVAAADFAVASETAIFTVANVGLGMSPDGASTWHLPRVVGIRKAKEMCLLGGRLGAAEAAEAGLVNWVYPDDRLDAETDLLLGRLAAGASVALGQAKLLLNAASENSLSRQIAAEARAAGLSAASEDFAEGLASFAEKRKPSFKGR